VLVIREAQMQAFRADMRDQLERRMVVHLTSIFERIAAQDSLSVSNLVHEAITAALAVGINEEFNVRRFVELAAEFGIGFQHLDWAKRVLADKALTATQKMDRLDDYTTFCLR
jgi:hypothetical protein